MKSVKSMTLRANESAMKEADKGILRSGHKNLGFRFLLILTLLVNMVFFNSCNKEDYDVIGDDDVIENTNNSSLEVRDFKNWFESQKIVKSLIGEQEPDWSKAELKIHSDNYKQVSFEIYKGKNSLGNDSIRELHIMNLNNRFEGGVLVLSFHSEECARTEYYRFSNQVLEVLEEGIYFTKGKGSFLLLKRSVYTVNSPTIRLKDGSTESNNDPCNSTVVHPGTATPLNVNSTGLLYSPDSYNCHAHVWGGIVDDTCGNELAPQWMDCPDIASSGYSEVTSPQVDDRWVSYGYYTNPVTKKREWRAIHSAFVKEVVNGQVTKLEAKISDLEIKTYNPDCSEFSEYMTDSIVYYRK